MFERTEVLKSFDGTELYFRCFTPNETKGNPKALKGVVIGVHGFGEHSGSYEAIAQNICMAGGAFAIFDLRGHGRSGPKRGDAENFHALVMDVIFIVNHTRAILGLNSKKDIFFGLLGISFGSVLLLYVAALLRDSCPPIMFLSPPITLRKQLGFWKKTALQVVSGFNIAKMPFPLSFSGEDNLPWGDGLYLKDEVNLKSISPRMATIFMSLLDEKKLKNAMLMLECNCSVICGEKDALVDIERVLELFPAAIRNKMNYKVILDAEHKFWCSTNENISENLKETIVTWMQG